MRTQLRVTAAVVLAISALTACGGSGGQAAVDDKYKQTWTTPYSETSCAAFLGEMAEQQRWAAAADMLTSARNKMDGGTGLPSDPLVTRFEEDISTACEGEESVKITEVGPVLYQMDPGYKP